MRRLAAVVLVGAILVEPARAAVLCARPRKDGSFDGPVKIREVCRTGETAIRPEDVGLCCTVPTSASTTTTSTSTVSCPSHTTTSLGIPDCFGSGGSCLGLCANARQCVPDATTGACGCTGPELPCGVVTYQGACGGTCPEGSTCQLYAPPLPNGCTDEFRCGCVPTP
jgi:hypothetical protein